MAVPSGERLPARSRAHKGTSLSAHTHTRTQTRRLGRFTCRRVKTLSSLDTHRIHNTAKLVRTIDEGIRTAHNTTSVVSYPYNIYIRIYTWYGYRVYKSGVITRTGVHNTRALLCGGRYLRHLYDSPDEYNINNNDNSVTLCVPTRV
jgi:hypothetical protein